MSDKPDNPPAFPASGHPGKQFLEQEGMTLRDYFAGQVIVGTLAHYGVGSVGDLAELSQHFECCAKNAYDIADVMLAERARRWP